MNADLKLNYSRRERGFPPAVCDGELKSVAYKRHMEKRRFVQKYGLRPEQVNESHIEAPPYLELMATVPAEKWLSGLPGRFTLEVRNRMPENTLSTMRHSELPPADQNVGRSLRSKLGGRLQGVRLETMPEIYHDHVMLLCDDGDTVVVTKVSEA